MKKMKKFTLLATVSILTLGVAACSMNSANSPTNLPAGEYTSTDEKTNRDGTNVKTTTNTNVYYDENGNKRAVQETETTRDPEGLMNKSTSSSTTTYK